MSIIVEAPNEVFSVENAKNVKVFLAGGISNCSDWQGELINKLKNFPKLTIYNPRRIEYPDDNPKLDEEQITWEFIHLQNADLVVFWFASGSDNPITLYELGMWANSRQGRPCIIGIDPTYSRQRDVMIQTALAKPDAVFAYNLHRVAEGIKSYVVDRTA